MWQFNVFFPQKPRDRCLPMIISFQFATFAFSLLPLRLIVTQQFFTGMLVKSHSVVDICNKIAVSNESSRDVTPCCLPKPQPLSNHFRTLSAHLQMLTDVAETWHTWILNWSTWLFSCKRKHEYGIRAKLWRDYPVFLLYDISLFIWCQRFHFFIFYNSHGPEVVFVFKKPDQ